MIQSNRLTGSFKALSLSAVIVLIGLCSPSAMGQKLPADYVNVFTGTSNSRWQLFPGASLPFGMVKLSPDNQGNVWNGGYEYSISSISGFSHLHAMCLSGLSIMPTSGSSYAHEGWVKGYPGVADGPFGSMWTAGYRSRFKKETEHASPGYYSVELLDYGIKAELTSTMRCGMLRFTYPHSESHLVLNFDFQAEEKAEVLEIHFEKLSTNVFKGYIRQKNGYIPGGYTVYFVLRLDKPVESADSWTTAPYTGAETNYGTVWRQKRTVVKNIDSFTGKEGSGVILNFHTNAGEIVTAQSGISFVSMEQAQVNLDTEMKPFGFDFDKVHKAAVATWNSLLGKVEVFGSVEDDKAKFYTNLYRSYSGKSVMNDVDGKYVDACHTVQTLHVRSNAVYTSDGLWGTQWDLIPVWTLVTPSIAESFVNSLLELARVGGWIPYAPVALGYSPIMGAQHQNSLIISSYQKGIRGFDADFAFKAILHDYTTPGEEYKCGGYAGNRHLSSYLQHGYVADEAGPASNTMEYAYDDWCFAQYARALGHEDVAKTFTLRSQNYRHIFDPEVGYVRQKHANGSWVAPFNVYKFGTVGGWNGKGFMEGTPFQYSFFVPQDVSGMISLMGRDTFLTRVENGFKHDRFDLGNQPSLESPFLFSYAGKPWLTQKYTRLVTETMFNTSPFEGWVGEEDEGQMGAYYVLLSMGLFEMDGGCATRPFYNLTTPVFDKVIIHLDPKYYSGKTFSIVAHGNSKLNNYIQSATLNGQALDNAWIYHSALVAGGQLDLVLGAKPNQSWGLKPPPAE